MPLFREEDVVVDLAGRCQVHGTQGTLAKALGVQQGEISGVINGHRPLRPGLATALGYRKVIMFEPID